MLTLVEKKINKDLSLNAFINIDFSTLASQATGSANVKETETSLRERLKEDIILDLSIQALQTPNDDLFNPKNIFITGVTGFLGSHVLLNC